MEIEGGKQFEKGKEGGNPDNLVEGAISAKEIIETGVDGPSPAFLKNAKEFFRKKLEEGKDWLKEETKVTPKGLGEATITVLGFGMTTASRIVVAIYKFIKTAIEKKGNIGFVKGYKIGKGIFHPTPEEKKGGKEKEEKEGE